jgi:hypothetical protein
MAADRKKNARTRKTTKKPAAKRQTYRDVPPVPTAKQIDESIRRGKSVSLDAFVKGVKL